MPKAKPVSLWPLTFDEAVTALIRADSDKVGGLKPPPKKKPMTKKS